MSGSPIFARKSTFVYFPRLVRNGRSRAIAEAACVPGSRFLGSLARLPHKPCRVRSWDFLQNCPVMGFLRLVLLRQVTGGGIRRSAFVGHTLTGLGYHLRPDRRGRGLIPYCDKPHSSKSFFCVWNSSLSPSARRKSSRVGLLRLPLGRPLGFPLWPGRHWRALGGLP